VLCIANTERQEQQLHKPPEQNHDDDQTAPDYGIGNVLVKVFRSPCHQNEIDREHILLAGNKDRKQLIKLARGSLMVLGVFRTCIFSLTM